MKAVLINSKRYLEAPSPDEGYEAARGDWKFGNQDPTETQYALIYARGKIRDVYRIKEWKYIKDSNRWRFFRQESIDAEIKSKCMDISYTWQQGDANPVKIIDLDKFIGNLPPHDEPENMKNMANQTGENLKLLRQFYQIIFYGPPGTGKTYAAKGILAEMFGVQKDNLPDLQGKQWDIVQFHPSYNYEDFVRGVQVKTENGQVAYETLNRTFGEMCERANNNSKNDYVLIIDEINRANVSAVLGELIYALEYRDEKIKTPYLGDIVIPSNLYIIGTMNTADRTIGQIDYAVRRRFAFIHCPPNPKIITNSDAKIFFALVDSLFDKPNEYLSPDFDANDVRIGHSYFLANGDELNNKILYQVVPILQEYVKDGVLTEAAEVVIKEIKEKAKKSSADESEEYDLSAEDSEDSGYAGNFLLYWKTNDNLFGFNRIGGATLNIVKDFVKNHNPKNVDEVLQKLSLPENAIISTSVDNFDRKNVFKNKEDIINLRNGNQYAVSYTWTNTPDTPKWKEFVEKIKEHGYVISNCRFVNVGEYGSVKRGWEECKKFGFLAAGGVYKGGNITFADGLKKLQPKEIVLAYHKIDETQKGFVAYGEVVEKAVPIRDFMVDGIPLLECKTADGSLYKDKYAKAQKTAHDDKDCDWILRVKWIKVLPDGEFVPGNAQRNVVWHRVNNINFEQLNQMFDTNYTEE